MSLSGVYSLHLYLYRNTFLYHLFQINIWKMLYKIYYWMILICLFSWSKKCANFFLRYNRLFKFWNGYKVSFMMGAFGYIILTKIPFFHMITNHTQFCNLKANKKVSLKQQNLQNLIIFNIFWKWLVNLWIWVSMIGTLIIIHWT